MILKGDQARGRVRAWERWVAAAVVAVLLVVGHDLLMAGAAHAAPMAVPGAASGPAHNPAADGTLRHAGEAGERRLDPSAGPSADPCGSDYAAVGRRSSVDLEDSAPVDLADSVPRLTASPSIKVPSAPPGLPPRVRRALLQVFRI